MLIISTQISKLTNFSKRKFCFSKEARLQYCLKTEHVSLILTCERRRKKTSSRFYDDIYWSVSV